MTLKQALESGYTLGDTRLHMGYVSRRVNPDEQPVMVAGGSRRGELYVELPNWKSTNYYIRQYLVRRKENDR